MIGRLWLSMFLRLLSGCVMNIEGFRLLIWSVLVCVVVV